MGMEVGKEEGVKDGVCEEEGVRARVEEEGVGGVGVGVTARLVGSTNEDVEDITSLVEVINEGSLSVEEIE